MKDTLEKRLIGLFPSKSLRDAIESSGYRLSGMQFIAAAYQYAPDFDTRLALLGELLPELEGGLRAYCERLISVQKEMLAEFKSSAPGIVFELLITPRPGDYEEHYLASCYEACFALMPKFFEEYGETETDAVRYEIRKRRISDGSAFAEDELGSMDLLKGGRIAQIELEGWYQRAEGCDGMCLNCETGCADNAEFRFPVFAHKGDAVSFTVYSGEKRFGIIGGEAEDDYAYVLPLDSTVIAYRDFENLFGCHEHIPAPLVERIGPEELPEKLRESYFAVKAFLDK